MARSDGTGAIRVMVSATTAIRRAGLESILRDNPAVKLAGSVYGVASLTQAIIDLQPDVVLIDVSEPDRATLSVAEAPSRMGDACAMVILVDDPPVGWVASALRSGVRGLLPRDLSADQILGAIQAANSGVVLLDPQISRGIAEQVREQNAEDWPVLEPLTPRGIQVLGMLAEGFVNKEIATRLGISDHTVKFHISQILEKLDSSSRTEAVTRGIRMGLIPL